jgi:hypothetical protein
MGPLQAGEAAKTTFVQKTMLLNFVGIVARWAIAVGAAFILSKTVPRMPRKVYRFVFLFVFGVPLTLIINYADVSFLGYHEMGWTWTFIFALLLAIVGTFWPPQTHNLNTP